jgi:hypothetical protein
MPEPTQSMECEPSTSHPAQAQSSSMQESPLHKALPQKVPNDGTQPIVFGANELQ